MVSNHGVTTMVKHLRVAGLLRSDIARKREQLDRLRQRRVAFDVARVKPGFDHGKSMGWKPETHRNSSEVIYVCGYKWDDHSINKLIPHNLQLITKFVLMVVGGVISSFLSGYKGYI